MAVRALRDLFMNAVACRATNLAMLAWGSLPFSINIAVTSITGLQLDIVAQVDNQRLVNIMAVSTTGENLGTEVRLMTFCTGRNQPMFCMVTIIT